MKEFEESLAKLKGEQLGKEGGLLSELMGQAGVIKDLAASEADLAARKNEILFKVTAEMEDCQDALRQAEQLVDRLKKHHAQLQSLYQILTKK